MTTQHRLNQATLTWGGTIAAGVIATSGVIAFSSTHAADQPGAKDHPLVSRYAGSEILKYESKDFDRYILPLAKSDNRRRGPEKSETIEGQVTRINYHAPVGRTALEVFRNYEQSLQSAGFNVIFSCEDADCGGDLSHAIATNSIMHHNPRDQKYLAAKLARPDGNAYVVLYTIGAYSVGGANKNRVFTQLDVIETRAMRTGQVTVDADAMARELADKGHVALYGIYFDSNKADVKPESKPALAEIAKLLTQNSALKLLVVGHTDTVGDFDYNIDLSRRRAQAVVQTLSTDHSIAATRLKPWGVGFASPVASNRSEDGRAKNRRVELVEQ